MLLLSGHVAEFACANVREAGRLLRRAVRVETAGVPYEASHLYSCRSHTALDEVQVCNKSQQHWIYVDGGESMYNLF